MLLILIFILFRINSVQIGIAHTLSQESSIAIQREEQQGEPQTTPNAALEEEVEDETEETTDSLNIQEYTDRKSTQKANIIDDLPVFNVLSRVLSLLGMEENEVAGLAEYQTRYDDEFDINVRVGDTPYAIAEAYMREYQPGPLPRIFQTTVVYDRNGIQIAEMIDEGRRVWVPLSQISPYLREAIIATEDASFYTNSGVDVVRVFGALRQNITADDIESGASTITMQLARNLFLGLDERYEQSFERKALEYYLSLDLTKLYTKDELLEMYLNLVYFGEGAYGAEAAAQTYFGKSAIELTPTEATLLAGLPQQPSNLNLYTNWADARERQLVVLALMVRHDRLTQAEADAIFAPEPRLNPLRNRIPKPNIAPHFVQYLAEYLRDNGYGEIGRAGLTVHSTLDMRMQTLAQKIVSEQVVTLGPYYNLNNGALLSMQVGTGDILAMVGSANFNDATIAGQFNTTIGLRQPGSTVKPILYAALFDRNFISPATILWDTPVSYADSTGVSTYKPVNYDERFHGLVTARSALANSYNVPMVKLFSGLGFDGMYETAQAMGLHSLEYAPETYGLSLALGGAEVRMIDMVTAYHTIANHGRYLPPSPILRLEHHGLGDITPEPAASIAAISPDAAFLVTDIMSDRVARRPIFGQARSLTLDRPAAVKTGTTNDIRDNWTIGFTRYMVTGVWTGNTDNSPMQEASGVTGAAPTWKAFMQGVLDDTNLLRTIDAPLSTASDEEWIFAPPDTVQQIDVCSLKNQCKEGGEYFSKSWLQRMGEAGPLGDSTIEAPLRYALRTLNGNVYGGVYCTPANEEEQETFAPRMTKLPDVVGQIMAWQQFLEERPVDAPPPIGYEDVIRPNIGSRVGRQDRTIRLPQYTRFVYISEYERDRFKNLAWSIARGVPINLGACDYLPYYTVQRGDTWRFVAYRFGIEENYLRAANPQAGTVLDPSEQLLVPTGVPIVVTPDSPIYTVQEGDVWLTIAEKFNVPLSALKAVNTAVLRSFDLLRPGDELVIPSAEWEQANRQAYIVNQR
ncbi:MAG: transglycosylase domain-containing protein [Chloroflexota bacterium]